VLGAGGAGPGGVGGSSAAGGTSAAGGSAGSALDGGGTGGSGATDASAGTGGTNGASGRGGSGGTAGTSGTAGSGGTAGSAGSAGSGGTGGTMPCAAPRPGSRGMNPLFTDQYTADPAPLVHDCTFYITAGHDEGSTGFVIREWFLLSSTDMVTWTKRVGMTLSTFSWANANAWASQMVHKSGKFYWYVPVQKRGSGMAIGVAVADSPAGPFRDAIGNSLIDDAYEMREWNFTDPGQTPFTIDPTVFVDDDGQAYLHYGGFGRLVVARLNADMISINGAMREVTPRGFFEAPYLTKRNGVYYQVYAAGANPAAIDYATSNSPLGPWTYRGRILDPLPNVSGQDAATSHPGVAEFAGQWYLVYHLSNGPNGGGTYKREVAVDKLTFESDGSIRKITPSSGLSF
jgi:beta-xylosidase